MSGSQHFKGSYCLYLQGQVIQEDFFIEKMEALGFSQYQEISCLTAQCHIPEYWNPDSFSDCSFQFFIYTLSYLCYGSIFEKQDLSVKKFCI